MVHEIPFRTRHQPHPASPRENVKLLIMAHSPRVNERSFVNCTWPARITNHSDSSVGPLRSESKTENSLGRKKEIFSWRTVKSF